MEEIGSYDILRRVTLVRIAENLSHGRTKKVNNSNNCNNNNIVINFNNINNIIIINNNPEPNVWAQEG